LKNKDIKGYPPGSNVVEPRGLSSKSERFEIMEETGRETIRDGGRIDLLLPGALGEK